MKTSQFIVILHSQRPEDLIAFYRDVVGLEPRFDVTEGAFRVSPSSEFDLIIEPHSEISGASAEPQRLLLNFVVEDAIAEQGRLKSRGVVFIRDATEEPGVGLFATFQDPDGNYCQLIEFRE